MNESFNKFKKKILLEAIIKSVGIAVAVGLLCFTVPYLIVEIKKINVNEFFVLQLIFISIGVIIVLFSLLFLILFPRKLKVAKRIDKQLDLKQKVQTMVEYENVDNPMTNYQREDTLKILSNISLKKFAMKFSVFFFVMVSIALALGVTTIVVASIEDTPDGPPIIEQPSYDLDNWTVRALLDLIEVVETSNINKDLKDPVVQNLKSLLISLEVVELESEMKILVNEVINDTSLRLDLTNSNNEVYHELKESGSPLVKELAVQINTLNVSNITNCIENFYVYLAGDPATVKEAIVELDNDFRAIISKSNLNQNEALTASLLKFATEIKNCEDASNVNESLSLVINNNKDSILDIIKIQAENKRIIEYVVSQLKVIFGLNEANGDINNDPDTNKPIINPVEPPKIPEGDNQGGYGTGEELFGSDDIIFDIEKGSVKYGEVISKYYGDLVGMFNDGTLPEDYKEFFDKYFDILFGFIEEEDSE